MKIVKKQEVIDAIQWVGKNEREVFDFLTGTIDQPITLEESTFRIDLVNGGCQTGNLILKNTKSEIKVNINDWIVKAAFGKFYSYTPDEFWETYLAVLDIDPANESYRIKTFVE